MEKLIIQYNGGSYVTTMMHPIFGYEIPAVKINTGSSQTIIPERLIRDVTVIHKVNRIREKMTEVYGARPAVVPIFLKHVVLHGVEFPSLLVHVDLTSENNYVTLGCDILSCFNGKWNGHSGLQLDFFDKAAYSKYKTKALSMYNESVADTVLKVCDVKVIRSGAKVVSGDVDEQAIANNTYTACTGGIIDVNKLTKHMSILFSTSKGIWYHGVVDAVIDGTVLMNNGMHLEPDGLCMPLIKCSAPELTEKETIYNSMCKYGLEHGLSYTEVVNRVVKSIPRLYDWKEADDTSKAEYYWPVFIQGL